MEEINGLSVEITCGNEAMQTPCDFADALERITLKIRSGVDGGKVFDSNGNSCGRWDLY